MPPCRCMPPLDRSTYRGLQSFYSRSAAINGLLVAYLTAVWESRGLLCFRTTEGSVLAPSVCGFLFVYEISREPLNGFAPNSHGRRAWSLGRISLNVKIKGRSRSPGTKTAFSTLSAACVWFMFGKTSLASSFFYCSARSTQPRLATSNYFRKYFVK